MKTWETTNGVKIQRVLTGRCHCYLIVQQGRNLLVDTGRRKNLAALRRGLGMCGVTAATPIDLVLTHCHFDHTENAARIKAEYHTRLMVHENEAGLLARGENPVIRGTNLFTRLLTNLLNRRRWRHHFDYEPVSADIQISDRYDLTRLGFPGYLLHTPGHTPGSISAIIDNETAVVGDTLFGIFKESAFPPFAGDPARLIESWKMLLETGCTTFLPAHGSERSREILMRQYHRYEKATFR
jgi:hydroxyacylglutathione hydrolase